MILVICFNLLENNMTAQTLVIGMMAIVPALFYLFQITKNRSGELAQLFLNGQYQTRNLCLNCKKENLIAKIEPIDIEMIHIHQYPQTPHNNHQQRVFGTLHQEWIYFLSSIDCADEVWLFHIPHNNIKGYARISNGKILGEFIYTHHDDN